MPESTQKQGRGCLFYGCLTTVIVFIGVLGGIYFGTRQAVKYAVQAFTTNAPGPVPTLDLSPGDRESITRALEPRAEAALRGPDPAPLILNEKELNLLLAQSSDLSPFTNQFYLRPMGTQLQAHVSLPLDQFKLWKTFTRRLRAKDLEGRYFNGVAIVQPGITNGALTLTIQDLMVNGRSLPGDFTGRLKDFDLAAGVRENPQSQSILNRIQSAEVRDSLLHLRLAPATNAPPR
jgi:hypothetical protein